MSDRETFAGLDEFDKWYNDHREITGSLTRTYIACRAAWWARSEITQALRFKLFYYTPFDGTSHTTSCTIWREDGQGHAEGFDGDRGPCNCGALENFERKRAETAEAKVAEITQAQPEFPYGGFEKAVLECNLAGPEAFATDENGRYRYDQMRSLEQFWRAASEITQARAESTLERIKSYIAGEQGSHKRQRDRDEILHDIWQIAAAHSQRETAELILGIAGVSPCPGCGKGMDGAFEAVRKVGDKWYHENCVSQREQTPAPEQPKCDCGAGDDAYLACHAEKCSLRKWANPASRSQAATEISNVYDHQNDPDLAGALDITLSPRIEQAAREIVEAFNDRGRTYDNSPDEAGVLAILDRCLSGEQ